MKIYDKAIWHIDGGEDKNEVIKRFKVLFDFLFYNEMLNDDGIEIRDFCMDETASLNSGLLNDKGIQFLDSCYDNIIKESPDEIKNIISKEYDLFIKHV